MVFQKKLGSYLIQSMHHGVLVTLPPWSTCHLTSMEEILKLFVYNYFITKTISSLKSLCTKDAGNSYRNRYFNLIVMARYSYYFLGIHIYFIYLGQIRINWDQDIYIGIVYNHPKIYAKIGTCLIKMVTICSSMHGLDDLVTMIISHPYPEYLSNLAICESMHDRGEWSIYSHPWMINLVVRGYSVYS